MMRRILKRVALVLAGLILLAVVILAIVGIPAPPPITTENMPRIQWKWAWKSVSLVRRLQASRSFAAWYGHEPKMLINVGTQGAVHLVGAPGAKPERLEGIPMGARYFHGSRDVPRPYVVYSLGEGGSDLCRFFRYDLTSGASTPLTTTPARGYAAGLDREGRRLAFFSNERNGTDSDIYTVEVENPQSKKMVLRATGDYQAMSWTADGRLLVGRMTSHTQSANFLLDPSDGTLQSVLGSGTPSRVESAARDRTTPILYVAADLSGEFTGVQALDPKSLRTTALAPDLRWDVIAVEALADGRTLALLINEDAQYRLYLLDIEGRKLQRAEGAPAGFPLNIKAHPTLPLIAMDVIAQDGVSGVWTYDVAGGRWEAWSVVAPAGRRAPPEVVRYPTFDRLDGAPRMVPAIVSRPAKRPTGRLAVVISIHGGPADQSLAIAGPIDEVMYENAAVIRPNVRGSAGYGKTYESLDDRERREDAVRDIGALLDWIAKQPDLDPERVVVTGGSYGGYMTLATLIHYGSRVRCGAELVGVSNWPAFLEESEKGHYPEAQRGEYGDSRDPAMRQFLLSISPATHADRIRVPLMIYQGANDVRVKPQQSRAMVQRIRAAGGQVTYLEAANEGHGIEQPLTQFYMGIASMEFLERCLGR